MEAQGPVGAVTGKTGVGDVGAVTSEPVQALWPAPAVLRHAWLGRGPGLDYLALPSARAPRLLVPTDVAGADRMLARFGGGRRKSWARSVLRATLRSGLSSWAPLPRLRVVPDPDGIESHVARVLGRAVRLGVLLGPPRANIKPVLQVFAEDGSTVAFAKVATSTVTAPLLSTEAAALRRLADADLAGVVVPELVDFGAWRDLPVLVQRALPGAQSGRAPTVLPTDAVAAIASSDGTTRGRLTASRFWSDVHDVGPARWHDLDTSPMRRLGDALASSDPECLWGAWHGDLGPWNAARGAHGLEVWDWERYERGVPVGLDGAHWRAQLDVGTPAVDAWSAMTRDVAEVLDAVTRSLPEHEPAGGSPTAAAVVAACYLLAIWRRYRHDADRSASAALRARVAWLLQVADAAVTTLEGTSA